MQTKIRLFVILSILIVNLISCQAKKIISFEKYENLDSVRKKEVDGNLKDVLNHIEKKENEIVLLFQYNCFLNKKIQINNGSNLDFPVILNTEHYGQKFYHFKKDLGKIEIKLSDDNFFLIEQIKGYDYIGICYYEKENKLYVEYCDYPRILFEE